MPQSDEQRDDVAAQVRQVEVCAVIPRAELARAGEPRSVRNDQPYSCTAELGPEGYGLGTTVGWSSMISPDPTLPDYGTVGQLGDVRVWQVRPDDIRGADEPAVASDSPARSCSATARFPSGAALYLDAEVPEGQDACVVVDALVPGMVERWRAAPRRGSSPDVAETALPGADPCAVGDLLPGARREGAAQVNACALRYREQTVLVRYEFRMRDTVAAGGIEREIAGRTVHRLAAGSDGSYAAVIGPELRPAAASDSFGPDVPVVSVDADTDEVANAVMAAALSMFPRPQIPNTSLAVVK
ncbi:peptidase [Nocardia farcinica]|uniref:peptidase n=1 Tax=Nocardia farcinica TaxID=37329 RepID=UPI000BF9DCC0|nr:peptidase [Nocardia farcinica]